MMMADLTWADHIVMEYGDRSNLQRLNQDYKLMRAQKLAPSFPYAARRPDSDVAPHQVELNEHFIAIPICGRQYWAFKSEADRRVFLETYSEGEVFPKAPE